MQQLSALRCRLIELAYIKQHMQGSSSLKRDLARAFLSDTAVQALTNFVNTMAAMSDEAWRVGHDIV